MLKTIWIAVILIAPAVSTSPAWPQGFGQNKVQYFDAKWSYLQSEHFDVYFYQGGYSVAVFVAETAEKSYLEISKSFDYSLRSRVSIITYQSHNDFEGTNVTFDSPEEGVGGFTEFFKNRIVIPYEGSYEALRHVTHHELTHAVMLEFMYGGGLGSIIASISRMPIPLWFIEGLAEYESRSGWDVESDLFMRDATINDYVPPINELYGFMSYKGGQSVWYYISQRYGAEKVGEILHQVKSARDVERGFKQSLGLSLEDLTKRWHQWLRKTYWPTVANLQDPEDIAKRLTDHRKKGNFVNNSPALSPQGDQLAFISDRSDYFDIYLMNVDDGKIKKKLLSGQTSSKFEELHWLRPGLSWSPDSKYLTFAAKAGKSDILYILEVNKAKVVRELNLGLDGIFSPFYSPDGRKITFTGMKNGHSDIYVVHLDDGRLEQITNDPFSDSDPAWSPDGKTIAFTSDRLDNLEAPTNPEFRLADYNYHQADIYLADAGTHILTRLTSEASNERTPEWTSRDGVLSYISDRDGVYNLYLHDLNSGEAYAVTNLLTGAFQPSWSSTGSLAFSSLFDAGYDIFYLRDPFDPSLKRALPQTQSVPDTTTIFEPPAAEPEDRKPDQLGLQETTRMPQGRIVFDDRYRAEPEEVEKVFLDSTEYLTVDGQFKVNKYKPRFTPDIVFASAAYSTFFGLQAMGLLAFSDMMGNHQIYLGLDLYSSLENSNIEALYLYLPKRTDFGVGIHHNVYFFAIRDSSNTNLYGDGYHYFRDRNYGFNFFSIYPFSKFTRLEASVDLMAIDRDNYSILTDKYTFEQKSKVMLPGISYVRDNILWGSVGPVNGMRARLSAYVSPDLEEILSPSSNAGWGLDFQTVIGDYRRYFKIGRDYTLAVRGTAGFSTGRDTISFFVGGQDNSINRRYNGEIHSDIKDIYFSNFVTPFRGGNYYEQSGNRFGLFNAEFRFPLIRRLDMGWPLPIGFRDIRGALFMDTGSAWNGNHFKGVTSAPNGDAMLQDLMMAYGLGTRLNLGYFVLRWDVAWRTWWNRTDKPRYFLSLGAEF